MEWIMAAWFVFCLFCDGHKAKGSIMKLKKIQKGLTYDEETARRKAILIQQLKEMGLMAY